MITQTAVTRSAAPRQVDFTRDVKRSRLQVRRAAKQLVKTNALPPQRRESVSANGLYIPAFSTQEGKHVTKSFINKKEYVEISYLSSAMLGSITGFIGLVNLPADSLLGGGILAASGVISGGILLGRKVFSKEIRELYQRMETTSYATFVEWAKNRYGIIISDPGLSDEGKYAIIAGIPRALNNSWVMDQKTRILYTVLVKPNGEVFLAPRGSHTEALLASDSATAPPLMVEALSVPVELPDEAADLHKELMASVALLKTQDLSVEAAHQVERTVNVVNTVITKYAAMAKLKTRKKTEQELVEFLRNQVAFIDELIGQHADELGKEISVEIAAVTAAEKNSLLLEVKR
jgi:hypothetical protein